MNALKHRARRAGDLPQAEPNVIPFIDVLLVLLVIFMVTAPKPTVDLRLDLPRGNVFVAPPIEPVIVDLREGEAGAARVFVADTEVPLSALPGAVIAAALSGHVELSRDDVIDEARLYVRADQDVAYGNVVAVIDELQRFGFAKVGIFSQSADAA